MDKMTLRNEVVNIAHYNERLDMQRYAFTIEYDGAAFVGWQVQSDRLSIQGVIEHALAVLTGQPVRTIVAGRTDAGVHARGQVFHCDLSLDMTPNRLCDALNALVRPHPISFLKAQPVAQEFNARLSATRRYYRYLILNRRAPPMLEAGRVWHMRHTINIPAMQQAANDLCGRHDFTTFRDRACQAKSPIRTLDMFNIKIDGEYVIADLNARSFLHHQVRNMIGTLVEIGLGKRSADTIPDLLAARDRQIAGVTAPARGLYLMQVDY